MFAASKSGKPAAAGAVTDPNFNSTALLLETTGTNGQQNNTFLDSSTNNFTITRTGTPTQGTFTPFSQTGWSGYFGGTSNYLTAPTNAAFAFGTGDFTVECWVFDTGTTAAFAQIVGASTYGVSNEFIISLNGSTRKLYAQLGNPAGSNSTGDITANVWTHVAVVRSGATLTFYINGIASGSSTNSNSVSSTIVVTIGASNNNNADSRFMGYMSNLRIVKGTAVYTANFTPPTAPLTAISGTSLLTLQSNYFKDNSSNNFAITATGTPSIQAFSPFAPAAAYSTATVGGSGYFNGTTDYLAVANNAALQLATATPFTIEAWVYIQSLSATDHGIIGKRQSGNEWQVNIHPSFGYLTFWNGSTTYQSNITLVINVWYYVTITWDGTTLRFFVNGVVGSTYTGFTVSSSTNQVVVGATGPGAAALFTGYISNLRLVNGTALYTANFTPPTAPLTAVTNTSLLLNETNAGIYDATAKNDVTTVGSAQASTTQSKFGGSSMLFNGTTDYLTTIDKPIAQLGTGDFTIEGWVYLSAVGTARGLVSKGAAATGWSVGVSALNQLTFAYTASTLTASTTLVVSTWYYFAVVRSGTATGNVKIYLNGSVDATSSGAITDNFNQTSTGYIGADRVGTSLLSGYLDEIRVTRVARTITTPTAAFPVS
jgi:hypothetical protein